MWDGGIKKKVIAIIAECPCQSAILERENEGGSSRKQRGCDGFHRPLHHKNTFLSFPFWELHFTVPLRLTLQSHITNIFEEKRFPTGHTS